MKKPTKTLSKLTLLLLEQRKILVLIWIHQIIRLSMKNLTNQQLQKQLILLRSAKLLIQLDKQLRIFIMVLNQRQMLLHRKLMLNYRIMLKLLIKLQHLQFQVLKIKLLKYLEQLLRKQMKS